MTMEDNQQDTLEEMYEKLSTLFNTTLEGEDRLTLRWSGSSVLLQILKISTPSEIREADEKRKRYQSLYKEYPGIEAKLFLAEHGERKKST